MTKRDKPTSALTAPEAFAEWAVLLPPRAKQSLSIADLRQIWEAPRYGYTHEDVMYLLSAARQTRRRYGNWATRIDSALERFSGIQDEPAEMGWEDPNR